MQCYNPFGYKKNTDFGNSCIHFISIPTSRNIPLYISPLNIATFYPVNEEMSDPCSMGANSLPVQMQLVLKSTPE